MPLLPSYRRLQPLKKKTSEHKQTVNRGEKKKMARQKGIPKKVVPAVKQTAQKTIVREPPEVPPPNPFFQAVAQRLRQTGEQQVEVGEVANRRLDRVLGAVVDPARDAIRDLQLDQAILTQEAVQAEVARRRQQQRQAREQRVARAAETRTFHGVELPLAEVQDNMRWIEEQRFIRDVNNPARFWRWEGGTRGGQPYRRSFNEGFIHLALHYGVATDGFHLHQLEQGCPRNVHNALNHGGEMPDDVDWQALFEAAVVIWRDRQRAAANKAQQKRQGPDKEHSPRHTRGPLYRIPRTTMTLVLPEVWLSSLWCSSLPMSLSSP